MILQALNDYYNRKAADPDSGIAPPGWERKEIPYIIVLDRNGNPVDIQSTVEGAGKTKKGKKFLVPQGEKRTSKINSNLLWDNPAYVIGIPTIKVEKTEAAKRHAAFRKKIDDLGVTDDPGIIAVRKFLAFSLEEKIRKLENFENWENLRNDKVNLSFKLAGESGLVTDSDAARSLIDENSLKKTASNEGASKEGVCMVTGQRDSIKRLHPSIKGVWGGKATASIVSFNENAFCSYGKEQGENAPVGKTAAFAYTTALNMLLDSENRMQVGEASTVFWSEKPTAFESNFRFFMEPPKDDPDRGIAAVKALFDSMKTGTFDHDDRAQRFYVLGLSPNAARIAIRFWIVSTVGEMEKNIVRFFNDTEIIHGVEQPDRRLSISQLLSSTAVEGKSDKIQPNLEGDFMRAILEGLPYPQTLLSAAIRRIRAEHKVTEHEQRRRDYTRAALIKACLNRSNHNPVSEELTVSLNLDNKNIGYRLGRLFAALEKIQAKANPGINATIRDRYYGAASGTPVTVFPNLMRLKNHHLSKLGAGGRIFFERLLAEILSEIDDFPKNLSLEEQGRFAIGYYHQSEDLYKKNSDKTGTEEVKPTAGEVAESLF